MGVLCSFEGKIFSHRRTQRTQEYFVYFKDDGSAVGKKIPSKPCKSLWEAAYSGIFHMISYLPATLRPSTSTSGLPKAVAPIAMGRWLLLAAQTMFFST